jgi:hypothetical protein
MPAREHVPEKWTRFSDKDMLQVFELARIPFDQVIPPERKARESGMRRGERGVFTRPRRRAFVAAVADHKE